MRNSVRAGALRRTAPSRKSLALPISVGVAAFLFVLLAPAPAGAQSSGTANVAQIRQRIQASGRATAADVRALRQAVMGSDLGASLLAVGGLGLAADRGAGSREEVAQLVLRRLAAAPGGQAELFFREYSASVVGLNHVASDELTRAWHALRDTTDDARLSAGERRLIERALGTVRADDRLLVARILVRKRGLAEAGRQQGVAYLSRGAAGRAGKERALWAFATRAFRVRNATVEQIASQGAGSTHATISRGPE